MFQIRAQHRNDGVRELIPADWRGVLVTDRGPSYDAAELAGVLQHKCHAHIARNIADAQAAQHPGARSFSNALRAALAAIRVLWSNWHAGGLYDRSTSRWATSTRPCFRDCSCRAS